MSLTSSMFRRFSLRTIKCAIHTSYCRAGRRVKTRMEETVNGLLECCEGGELGRTSSQAADSAARWMTLYACSSFAH